MTTENGYGVETPDGDGREITARFSTQQLVRGWAERAPRAPRAQARIRFGARTDLGRIRENNEDKFDFYEPEDPTLMAARGSLYAVADGMGGHAAGQIASEMALKSLLRSYYDSVSEDIAEALQQAIVAANDEVHSVAAHVPERGGMGTTLTVAIVVEDRVYVGQVGDSRAYLLRDGEISQVTLDHSWVAEQVRLGTMTEEEAESSPYRNVITRSIGTQAEVEPDIFVQDVRPGDVWVLCSDGLTGHVQADEIRLIVSTQSPSESARQLVELANARGGRDNITVFVVSIRDLIPGEPPTALPGAETGAAETAPPGGASPEERRGLLRFFGR